MFCPNCHAEFRPGFTRCSDCDVDLVETSGAIPEGIPEDENSSNALEPFHETWSSEELGAILEAFEEGGVPYVVQAGTALSLLTSTLSDADELPEAWQARILVPGTSARHARQLLKAVHAGASGSAGGSSQPERGPIV